MHEDGRSGGFGRWLSTHPAAYVGVVQLHPPRPHSASESEVARQPCAASAGSGEGGEDTRAGYSPDALQLQCQVAEEGPWLWSTGASLWA